jgi:hypothetical protein
MNVSRDTSIGLFLEIQEYNFEMHAETTRIGTATMADIIATGNWAINILI